VVCPHGKAGATRHGGCRVRGPTNVLSDVVDETDTKLSAALIYSTRGMMGYLLLCRYSSLFPALKIEVSHKSMGQ